MTTSTDPSRTATPQPITLEVEGGLAGHLYLPDHGLDRGTAAGRAADAGVPGAFTGVEEQVVATHSARLAHAGNAALAFGHRGFGESGGRRHHENPAGTPADILAVVGFPAAPPRGRRRPDRPARGVPGRWVRHRGGRPRSTRVRRRRCGRRLRRPAGVRPGQGLVAHRKALADLLADPEESIPAVSPDGGRAAMPGREPWEDHGTSCSASPHRDNEVTTGSLPELMTLDTMTAAALLGRTPTLIVHGTVDVLCGPAGAEAVAAAEPGSAELRWMDTTDHIDLHDASPSVDEAAALVEHLRRSDDRTSGSQR